MSPVALTSVGAIAPMRNHRHGFNGVAVDPSGRYVATSDVDMVVEVWEQDHPVREIALRSSDAKARNLQRVRALCFAADGSHRLYAAAGERLVCIDAETGRILWHFTAPRTWGFLVTVPQDLAVVPDGRVAATFDSGLMMIFDADGRVLERWRDDEAPRSLRFLDWFTLIGTDSFRLIKWDIGSRSKSMRLRLPDRAYAMELAPEHPVLAVRTLSHLRLVSTLDGSEIASLAVQAGLPRIAFHPHEPWVAVAERNRVRVADFQGATLAEYPSPDAAILSLAFSADGVTLLAGLSDRTLRRWRSL